ncbi:MAG: hypothetical protein ACREME_13110 [Gemmatimonadales bacterium]
MRARWSGEGAVVLLLLLAPWRPGAAQWQVGLEVGTAQYGGTTRNVTGSDPTYVRPDHATFWGVSVGWQGERIGVTLRARTGTPGIAGAAPDFTVTDRTTGGVAELVPLLGVTLLRVGPNGRIAVEAGPALDVWDIDGDEHARFAAVLALGYDWLVAGRFRGAVRAEGALGRSIVDAGDLPPELARRATWRYGVMLGLRYRL